MPMLMLDAVQKIYQINKPASVNPCVIPDNVPPITKNTMILLNHVQDPSANAPMAPFKKRRRSWFSLSMSNPETRDPSRYPILWLGKSNPTVFVSTP